MSWFVNVLPVTYVFFQFLFSNLTDINREATQTHRTGGIIRSQLWETIKGWFLMKGADVMCTCMCVWVGVACSSNISSFPQVQLLLGTLGYFNKKTKQNGFFKNQTHDDERELQYQWQCVCCHCVNVHQSIQLCLQSLLLVIYSQAEQGCAFETAPGKQIKGKGSSSSSWKISTPGSVTSTHSPDTLIFNQVHSHSCWLGRINVYPWKPLRGLSLSLVQMHIFTEYNQAGQPPDAGWRMWEVNGSCLSARLCFQLHAYISEGLASVIPECLKMIFPKLQCNVQHKQTAAIFSTRYLTWQRPSSGVHLGHFKNFYMGASLNSVSFAIQAFWWQQTSRF